MHESISQAFDIPKDLELKEKVILFAKILDDSNVKMLNLNSVAFTRIFFDLVTKENKYYVKRAIIHINKTGRYVARSSKNKRGRNVKIYRIGYQPERWMMISKIPVATKVS